MRLIEEEFISNFLAKIYVLSVYEVKIRFPTQFWVSNELVFIMQGVPKKWPSKKTEITREIFGLENQLRYFLQSWNM